MSSIEPSYCIRANLPLASEASVAKAKIYSTKPVTLTVEAQKPLQRLSELGSIQFLFRVFPEQLGNSSASFLHVSRFQVNPRKQQRLNCVRALPTGA